MVCFHSYVKVYQRVTGTLNWFVFGQFSVLIPDFRCSDTVLDIHILCWYSHLAAFKSQSCACKNCHIWAIELQVVDKLPVGSWQSNQWT